MIKRVGKKGQEWIDAKKILYVELKKRHISVCEVHLEGCTGRYGLTLAHRFKRRDPRCEHSISQVILCCLSCHMKIETNDSLTEDVFKRLRPEYDRE